MVLLLFTGTAGCTASPRSESFTEKHTYTATGRYSEVPLYSMSGVSDGWIIYTSALDRGTINARYHTFSEDGSQNGSLSFHLSMEVPEESRESESFFYYDFLVNKNYMQRAEFIKSTQYYETVSREVGYREVIVDSVQFRNLQCIAQLSARVSTPRMVGYILQKKVHCPIVVDGKVGRFGFTYTVTQWRDALEMLQAYYGEDYLRLAFRDLAEMLKPSIESLVFHVDFSQNSDSLIGYDYPSVPEGMTYTDFYLSVIPKHFQLMTHPQVPPRRRVLTAEDITQMKSRGLTLAMAKKWHFFFEKASSEREVFLRSTRAPTGRVRTEEGIQIRLREAKDMARLFSEVIEQWNEVP